jgi:hypothetical protein
MPLEIEPFSTCILLNLKTQEFHQFGEPLWLSGKVVKMRK